MNTYQYILDGAVDKDGKLLIGFRISEFHGYDKKFAEVIRHCINKEFNKIILDIGDWSKPDQKDENPHLHIRRRRVLVTASKK